jgi:hypothetical protein
LTAENGAVAPSGAALAATRTAGGIASGQRISYAFATAQALPALAYVPEGAGALAVSAPATATENTTVSVTVTGLAAGEPACVSFGGQAKPVTGTGAALNVTFQLPAGLATHTFRLTTLGGSTTAVTTATATPTSTPTPAPVPQVGALQTRRVVKVMRNRFAVRVACEGTQECLGKLTVRTASKERIDGMAKAKFVTVSERRYSVASGDTERVVLRLTRTARDLVADRRIKVKAILHAPGAERSVETFWLKAAKG